MSIIDDITQHDIKQTTVKRITYSSTGYFSKLVSDYLDEDEKLQPFYKHPVSLEGIKASIEARKSFNTDRELLAKSLFEQYEGIELNERQKQNIQLLTGNNTFTITTAHQPNLFTGPLYFIYKILHAIKLVDELNKTLPEYHFVPVYYMGSEDADIDELGFINLNGDKLAWNTTQTGAFGRMKIDKDLHVLIDKIKGQIGIFPYGNELISLFRKCYSIGKTIQQATLELVNDLFADYGLLVVIPDNAALKASFSPIIKKELTEQFSKKAVSATLSELNKHYKVHAAGRDINLFYLLEDKRERIELGKTGFTVEALNITWTLPDILAELENHPERFSANVILRGLFQETILPNIVFIGGGGELAYWLELKKVFEATSVPYPMLILRNSFLLVKEKIATRIDKLGFKIDNFFDTERSLVNQLVNKNSSHKLSLNNEVKQIEELYHQIKMESMKVDPTLAIHIEALEKAAVKKLIDLEKKILKAEKRKFINEQHQIAHIKEALFPKNNLQERTDNFSTIFAMEGKEWLNTIYHFSDGLKQEFSILTF